jgi:hypothetical protein
MRARYIAGALLLIGAAGPIAAQSTTSPAPAVTPLPKPGPLPADSMELARAFTRWFYTAQTDSLIAHTAPGGRSADQTKADILGNLAQLTSRAGHELWVVEEKFITRNGRRQYWRTAKFSDFDEPILVRFVMDEQGRITGFGLSPKSQAPPIDPQ